MALTILYTNTINSSPPNPKTKQNEDTHRHFAPGLGPEASRHDDLVRGQIGGPVPVPLHPCQERQHPFPFPGALAGGHGGLVVVVWGVVGEG